MWKVIKLNNKWCIYNTLTGTILRKFKGNRTKKEAIKECQLRTRKV